MQEEFWSAEQLLNRIYQMDCLELLKKMPDETVSLILTDPPYGISYQNQYTCRKHRLLQGDNGIPYEFFAKEAFRVLKNNSHAYFFTRYDCYPHHYRCLEQAGFRIKNCLVVEKGTVGGIGDLYGSYANNSEWIIFCQKGKREFQQTTLLLNRKAGQKTKNSGGRVPRYKRRFNACWFGNEYPKATYNSVWQKKNGIYHPTVKNTECLSWLIQLSSMEGELVFDGFLGTGSTAVAAKQADRMYLGAEIDRGYFEIAQKRILENG